MKYRISATENINKSESGIDDKKLSVELYVCLDGLGTFCLFFLSHSYLNCLTYLTLLGSKCLDISSPEISTISFSFAINPGIFPLLFVHT